MYTQFRRDAWHEIKYIISVVRPPLRPLNILIHVVIIIIHWKTSKTHRNVILWMVTANAFRGHFKITLPKIVSYENPSDTMCADDDDDDDDSRSRVSVQKTCSPRRIDELVGGDIYYRLWSCAGRSIFFPRTWYLICSQSGIV